VPKTVLACITSLVVLAAACDRRPDYREVPQPPDPSLHEAASTGPSVIMAPADPDTPTVHVDTTLLPDTLPPAAEP
jgi:hypothetical protein